MSIRVDRGAGCGGASWCSWKEVSAKRGGNVIRGGAWVLGERMAGSKKKKKDSLCGGFCQKYKKMLPLRVAYY